MKQRLSTLIDFFTRDRVPVAALASEVDDIRQRHGASMRPERLRERRGPRARMQRGEAYRIARAKGCVRRTATTLNIA
ncbi:hypothetical protein [Paraburkholderia diazotrophica]|uniref:Uncharacterized protein n=1 Tax=Paraburkholderia diazotrophica TaxID=667676 RepID=A0A1H6ZVL1_9BURK|nr:hypothetical protein [Paraburkholderia diazotrophica]SEJ57509.1 hypothetical protein SAMN05192539_1013101 [Paraburkholderia diazotrophica]